MCSGSISAIPGCSLCMTRMAGVLSGLNTGSAARPAEPCCATTPRPKPAEKRVDRGRRQADRDRRLQLRHSGVTTAPLGTATCDVSSNDGGGPSSSARQITSASKKFGGGHRCCAQSPEGSFVTTGGPPPWKYGTVAFAYLRAAQAYMLISMPTGTSTIFGVFQAIEISPCCRDDRLPPRHDDRIASKISQAGICMPTIANDGSSGRGICGAI